MISGNAKSNKENRNCIFSLFIFGMAPAVFIIFEPEMRL
jgi:hypothetical protein